MGQVPNVSKYLLIGRGKLARHWAHYLDLLEVDYSTWNRDDNSTADLIQKLKSITICFLCINDDQIFDFYTQFKDQGNQFVHFSGTLEINGVPGFHPLMSFSHDLYDLETYQNLHFVGSESVELFRSMIPEFKNQYSKIEADQKALYHGLCVLSGNGTTLLWDLMQKEFEKLGLPEDAHYPYLKQITENILQNQQGRWTGPWYRNDLSTIEKNKEALSQGPLKELYEELARLASQPGKQHEKHPRL